MATFALQAASLAALLMVSMPSIDGYLQNPPDDWFTTEDCGIFYAENGTISSPNFPNPYPRNFYCVYYIYVNYNYFYLTITHKNIQPDDSLTFYDYTSGYFTLEPYVPRYTRYVTITFRTNNINEAAGFQIHWSRYSPVYVSPWNPQPNSAYPMCSSDNVMDFHYHNYYQPTPLTNVTALADQYARDGDADQTELPSWWYTVAPDNSPDNATEDPYQQYLYTTVAPNQRCSGIFNSSIGKIVHDFDSEYYKDLTNEICEYIIYSDVNLRLMVEHVGNHSSGSMEVANYMVYNSAISGYNATYMPYALWSPVAHLRGKGSFELCGYAFKVQVLNPRELTNSSSYMITWHPAEHEGIKVRCDENFYQVEINSSVLEQIFPGVNVSDFRLNDDNPSCRAMIFDDVIVFQSSLTGCGMTRSESLSHYVYENWIVPMTDVEENYNVTTNPYFFYNVITRTEETGRGLEVHCRVTRMQQVHSKFSPTSWDNHIASGLGEFTLDMDFYTDVTYSSRVASYPMFTALNEELYVQISLQSNDQDLQIVLGQCHAVNTPYLFSMMYGGRFHQLITRGCPTDSTTQILTSNATEERFSFRSFRFINSSFTDIYVVCYVTLCNTTDNNNCQTGCQPGRIYKRSAEEDDEPDNRYRIQQGPFRISELGLTAGCEKTRVLSPVMTLMLMVTLFLNSSQR